MHAEGLGTRLGTCMLRAWERDYEVTTTRVKVQVPDAVLLDRQSKDGWLLPLPLKQATRGFSSFILSIITFDHSLISFL